MLLQGKLQLLLEMIFLSIDYLLLLFPHSLGGVPILRICFSVVDLRSKSIHQTESHLVSKGSQESFVRVRLDAQVALHSEQALQRFHARLVELVGDLLDLSHLDLESRVLSLLTVVRLLDHVVKNAELLRQVASDVLALRFGHLFDGVLLLLQDLDLLLTERHLLC